MERAIANGGRSRGAVGDLVARRQVLSFFAVTFAWSWGYWAAVGTLFDAGSISYLVTMPGLWGPVVAAVAVTWAGGGSVLPAVIAHAGIDAPALLSTTGTVPDDAAFVADLSVVAVYWLLVVVLVAKNGVGLTGASSLPSPGNPATDPEVDDDDGS